MLQMNFNRQTQNQNVRPHSSVNMTDLPIYVVPLELWDEQQNLALNDIINETISAGFIRVEPEQLLSDLRIEIDEQLGYECIPKDFVFCKNVGRCLAQVREKQESLLKVKHFLPPNSYSPEMFVVDSIVSKRSNMTSDSNKTYNSSYIPDIRDRKGSIDEDIQRERFEQERQREMKRLEDENNARIKERESKRREEEENIKIETERKRNEKEMEFTKKAEAIKPSNDPEMESRRMEIENLQREIMKRYQELDSLENEHRNKIIEWEIEDERRKQEEESRRKLFEEMELERKREEEAIIAKQKEELRKLQDMLKEKEVEIHNTEEELEIERNKREEIRMLKENEMKNLKVKVQENSKVDSNVNDQIQQLQKELEEMDMRQKDLEQIARAEREQAEADFEKAQIEFERLKLIWEEESNMREKENSDRLLEEQRLREIYEQNQREHELRMEEERKKMNEERERFNDEQKHWDEERQRYEEEEKNRLKEIDVAIEEAMKNRTDIPKFELKDPDLILIGATEGEQKHHLKMILKALKVEREEVEHIRDNVIKKVRIMQIKTQNRRNNLRDLWKKKYFDEKKKTLPIEDQLNRYKDELESIHKKLLNSMEIGMKDHKVVAKHPGVMSPSNKANLLLQAFRIQHDIEDIQQKIGFNQMRLSAEKKLRDQTEIELKMIKIEAMHKKIRLSRTRSDQLAIMPRANSTEFIYSPHHISLANSDPVNQ